MIFYADAPNNYNYGFQDPATSWMYSIIELHDNIIFYLIILLILVLWFFIRALFFNQHFKFLAHGDLIEIIWTLTPALILWAIGIPSLTLLYMMDEILDAELTIKIIGNQWYWTYEYSDYDTPIILDSFLIPEEDLQLGDYRLLTVDNSLILPINTSIRLLITSNDVIHSFALPSLGLKMDAMPGRLNSTGLIINRPSTYYGQCSELCGILHGFMPINIQGVKLSSYLNFIYYNSNN